MSIQLITPKYHWTFAEISNSVTNDIISNEPAQLSNVVASGQGRIGNAITLNGSDNSFLSLGRLINQFGQADFTVACGVKIAPTDRRIELFGNRTSVSNGNFFCLRVTPKGEITAEVDDSGSNYIFLSSGAGFDDDTWHHLAVVRQGSTLKLYINSKIVATKTNGIANISNDNDFRLGNPNPGVDDNAAAPTAAFEDLRIYDRALSDAEILALVPPIKSGEIELSTADGLIRIWSHDAADLSAFSTTFTKLRLGTGTGATLYKEPNYQGIFQEIPSDVPDLLLTRLEASPKSFQIWPSSGKPFTGKYAILAPNGQYLSLAYQSLATSPSATAFELFNFHINIEQQRTQLIPGLSFSSNHNTFAISTKDGLRQTLFCVEEQTGFHRFSLMNSQGNLWLTIQPLSNLICLKSHNGQYLRAKNDGLGSGTGAVLADSFYPRADSVFELIKLQGNQVALKAFQRGLYVGVLANSRVVADFNASSISPNSYHSYELIELDNGQVAFKKGDNYFCAEDGGGKEIVANKSKLDIWEKFERIQTPVGRFSWTDKPEDRAVFTRAVKVADNEGQVGELLPGEVAFYKDRTYRGKTLILYSGCDDFRAIEDFNDTVSSVRLGPSTGATLYVNTAYDTSQNPETDMMDMVEDIPDLTSSQIGNDKLSAVKIWSNITPRQANLTFSTSLSQDYKLVGEELQDVSSYRTILKFLPEVTKVEVWATDQTVFEFDGKYYEVNEDQCVELVPNGMGRIMITSEAEGINTPGLKIRTSTMQSHERVVIFPDREVHRQLAGLDQDKNENAKNALWNAKDAEGKFLVNRENYTEADVASVQQTVAKTMRTLSYVAVDDDDDQLINRVISTDTIEKPWKLSFEVNDASFFSLDNNSISSTSSQITEQELGEIDFARLLNQASGSLAQGFSFKNVFKQIKNAVKNAASVVVGVAQNVATGIVNVANKVVDTVKQVVAIVVDAAGRVVQFVIDTAEKAAAFVEGVVEKIGVAAKKLAEYLRSIFDWGDILDTQRYLTDAIDTGLGYAVKLAEAAKKPVDNFMTELRETVQDSLNKTIDKLDGDKTELQKNGPELPEQVEWLLSKLTSGSKDSNEDSILVPTNSTDSSSSDGIESFVSNLLGKFENISQIMMRSMEGLGETIATLIRNPYRPQLALVAILKMVRDVIDDFLKLIGDIAIDFLSIIKLLVKKIRELINTEINIPFITALFKKIGAGKLTLLNLAAILLAIPVTITSKLVLGKKPFSDSPSLTLSTRDDSIAGWGLIALMGDMLNGLIAASLDVVPEDADPSILRFKRRTLGGATLDQLSALLSGISWLASFPDSPDFDGGRPYDIASYAVSKTNHPAQYWQRVMWGWRTCILGLDLIFTFVPSNLNLSEERLKRGSYATTIILTLLSVVDLGLTSKYLDASNQSDESKREHDLSITGELFGVFPNVFAFLRVPPFPPYGLVTLGTLDVVCALVAFGVGLAEIKGEEPQSTTS